MRGPAGWTRDRVVTCQRAGLYLYCLADTPERAGLGRIGLGGTAVYSIPCGDLCAVVHRCPGEPYISWDRELVMWWVLAHHRVVEESWSRWGTVLPLTFNTIFPGRDDGDAGRRVREWLSAEHSSLRARLFRLRGKAEYRVRISWDPGVACQRLTQSKADAPARPNGPACPRRKRTGELLRGEIEAPRCFQAVYQRIRGHTDELQVKKAGMDEKGSWVVLDISCLASGEQALELGRELEEMGEVEGFLVALTGPWPPYSFARGP